MSVRGARRGLDAESMMVAVVVFFVLVAAFDCCAARSVTDDEYVDEPNDDAPCGRFVVELTPETSPEAFAADTGAILIGPLSTGTGPLSRFYEFTSDCGRRRGEVPFSRASADERAISVSLQEPKRRYGRSLDGESTGAPPEYASSRRRVIAKDSNVDAWTRKRTITTMTPFGGATTRTSTVARDDDATATRYAPKQWHLADVGNPATCHVLGAWARGYTGVGVTIAFVDDGVDHAHLDIAPGYAPGSSRNYNRGNRDDPRPLENESHGTSVSGLGAASGVRAPPGQGMCGHGVARRASVAGVRLINLPVTDAEEARALSIPTVDVYSCSWGPQDDGRTLDGPGPLTELAMSSSRSVYVWASGNGNDRGDSCAYDGYAQQQTVLAVGAVTHEGTHASYSEGCPALFGCAPSSGDGMSITTTDIAGPRGASTGDCRTDFGGTSAAAPIFAGAVALVVSANRDLDEFDIARVVMRSSRRIDPSSPTWHRNAAGVWHSDWYGFGIIDAETAVVLASDYEPLPPSCTISVGDVIAERGCQILGGETCTLCVDVPMDSNVSVERAFANVTVDHQRRGDLDFALTSPSGTVSTFARRPRDTGRTLSHWTFESLKTWGENSAGTWCLKVRDVSTGGTRRGELVSWSLSFVGVSTECL